MNALPTFLGGRPRQRANSDICRSTRDLLQKFATGVAPSPKIEEELARNLGHMKLTLQGTTDTEANPQQIHQLIHLLMKEDILLPLAKNIHKLPFESRKDAQVIFSSALRYRMPNQNTQEPLILPYIVSQCPDIVIALCNGYDHRESAMPCGGILREALKHDSIAALIVYDEPQADSRSRGLQNVDPEIPASGGGVFWKFFDWIDKSAFEVSADAFNTFREILTRHKRLVAHFLLTNNARFVSTYNNVLMKSSSYVTKRQSIKLLGEILLERSNYNLMTSYVESGENLKLCMNLLKADARMVNYEGFHIFKVFVANPNKSVEVQRILITNKERLLRFLPSFLDDRTDDMQFSDEKAYLIRQIEQLPLAPVAPPPQQPQSMPNGGRGAVAA